MYIIHILYIHHFKNVYIKTFMIVGLCVLQQEVVLKFFYDCCIFTEAEVPQSSLFFYIILF